MRDVGRTQSTRVVIRGRFQVLLLAGGQEGEVNLPLGGVEERKEGIKEDLNKKEGKTNGRKKGKMGELEEL